MRQLLQSNSNIPSRLPSPLSCSAVVLLLSVLATLCLSPVPSLAQLQKKVLYIDSYHAENIWSSDITAGIRLVLEPRKDIELKIFRMDTKRHQSETFKQESARKARELIESWKPDVVIASDDNASKYLIAPYYLNTALPFVFCGLNWDASVYGFPAENVTGMLEVALFEKTLSTLQQYTDGKRIGYLASDTVSERKEYENIRERFGHTFEARFVSTFDELKQAYLELQRNTDMVILQECRSVKGFNHLEMVNFVRRNTTTPTAAMQKYLMHYALFTFAKSGEEQGEYAAHTALEILAGKSPKDIPITANKKVEPYLNLQLAKALGIKFPVDLISTSHLISAEQKKLLYINSYHAGYAWSDEIEKGLLKALNITRTSSGAYDDSGSEVQLKIFRMDTKFHQSEAFKIRSALAAKTIIDQWKPDIIVTSDDNAAKYLIAPHLKETKIPVVFCGLNWDAASYHFPSETITGMVEVNPILETIALLKSYAQGNRLGYIGSNTYSDQKELEHLQNTLHLTLTDGALVTDFRAWKSSYLRLQKTVDMLIIFSPTALLGWQDASANAFIQKYTKIPTGCTDDNSAGYALLGKVKIAEEQGWWAGNTALNILDGTPVKNIAVTTNKSSQLYLNMKIAKALGIKFPLELLEQARLIQD